MIGFNRFKAELVYKACLEKHQQKKSQFKKVIKMFYLLPFAPLQYKKINNGR